MRGRRPAGADSRHRDIRLRDARHHALPNVKSGNLPQVQGDDPRSCESWTRIYAYSRKRGEEASLFAGNVSGISRGMQPNSKDFM